MDKERNRKIYELWTDIQDIVGSAKLWPKFVRKLFWTRNINHKWRPILAAFVFVNGLNPVVRFLLSDKKTIFKKENHLLEIFNNVSHLQKQFDKKGRSSCTSNWVVVCSCNWSASCVSSHT